MRLLPLALLLPLAVHAQQAAPAQSSVAPAGPSLLPLVLALVFVLALIPVAIWLLKRMGAGTQTGAAGMRVVAQLPLGTRERVVVVEAGERWLLLGVTASSINRIGTLPKGELPANATSFQSLLNKVQR
jgi:flagellar protein FliO/FliZ